MYRMKFDSLDVRSIVVNACSLLWLMLNLNNLWGYHKQEVWILHKPKVRPNWRSARSTINISKPLLFVYNTDSEWASLYMHRTMWNKYNDGFHKQCQQRNFVYPMWYLFPIPMKYQVVFLLNHVDLNIWCCLNIIICIAKCQQHCIDIQFPFWPFQGTPYISLLVIKNSIINCLKTICLDPSKTKEKHFNPNHSNAERLTISNKPLNRLAFIQTS